MRDKNEVFSKKVKLEKKISELEKLIELEVNKILKLRAPEIWSSGSEEVQNSKGYIRFLSKEINVAKGKIEIIDWIYIDEKEIFS